MTPTKKRLSSIILVVVAALLSLAPQAYGAGPMLENAIFFGGAGDQLGRSVAIANGQIYAGGSAPAWHTALVVRFEIPPGAGSPSTINPSGYSYLYGITGSAVNVYGVGSAYPPRCGANDNVGETEGKALLALFDASTGIFLGCHSEKIFPSYDGWETFYGVTTTVESGSPVVYAVGGAETCGGGWTSYVMYKYDSSGEFLLNTSEPDAPYWGACTGHSNLFGATVMNEYVYGVGRKGSWDCHDCTPLLVKYNSSLVNQWIITAQENGEFNAVTALDGYVYAVGATGTFNDPGARDFLIEKYDESGTRVWRATSGGSAEDVLHGVVTIGNRLFAVGYTKSGGGGEADVVILEIDPDSGNTLNTTLYGGGSDDIAYGATTDGTDLYVVGESRSFETDDGNLVGQDDLVILRYSITSQNEMPWPMFQHDPQHTGRSPYAGPQSPMLKWQFQVEGMPGSPAIGSDGAIYVPTGMLNEDTTGYLYAINPDGTQKWRYQFAGIPSSTAPAISADGTIYVHMNGDEGNAVAVEKLYAINPDGSLKWLFLPNGDVGSFTGYTQSSPAIGSDGTIYVGSYNTFLFALNTDGTIKWSVSPSFSSITSSPSIATDGTIYVSDALLNLYAFNPDGTPRWTADISDAGGSGENSPSVGPDGTIYLPYYVSPTLYAIKADGSTKWGYTLGNHPLSTPAIAADGTIYIVDDGLYALNPDGSLKWKFPMVSPGNQSPIIDSEGTIYCRNSWGFYAVNPNGTQKWQLGVPFGTPSGSNLTPAIGSDGTLYIPLPDIFNASNQYLKAYASTPMLQFSSATYSVNENGGSVTITVTRTGGSSGAVGVSYATSNGTATAGSDYAATSGTLSWANGDTENKTFDVQILTDSVTEGNETVNLTLSSPTGGATLGSPSTAVITILDKGQSDFDGDGKVDIAVWRPGDGYWYILRSSDGGFTVTQWGLGSLNDIPVPGDYDGDGKTDMAVWRPGEGNWYILKSSDGEVIQRQWGSGALNDVLVPGDYDGDGKTDITIWRPGDGFWHTISSKDGSILSQQWGAGYDPYNDKPVPGDYDGDGKTDYAVWRLGDGFWYILNSKDGSITSQQWGSSGLNDVPVPGDYDGDAKTDIAVWRPGEGIWYIISSKDGSVISQQWGAGYAPYNDVPVPGDYDGDGKTDIAIWRTADGYWYVMNSKDGSITATQWGAGYDPYNDQPISQQLNW